MQISTAMQVARLDGSYPRPQLRRTGWTELDGEWDFAYDDDDVGRRDGWYRGADAFDRRIRVPFPPESPASGIGDTGFHPVVWYRRVVVADDLAQLIAAAPAAEPDAAVILHFGAVDFRADVWVDGELLGSHDGGQTPFEFELPARARDGFTLVVRAEDDHADVTQPRGKQDWLEEPHVIWYHRTTGIWQPVWLELAGADRVTRLRWNVDVPRATVDLGLLLARRPAPGTRLEAVIEHDGEPIASLAAPLEEPEQVVTLHLPRQRNGQAYEQLLWSPEHPTLLDARIRIVRDADGAVLDEVYSYLGLRSAAVAGGRFLLNDRPCYVRSVLEQGYWPETHLAAPSHTALRDEVELIKALGFNAVRLHEKAEDPRLLFWADRLGLLVWGEIGSAFEFSPRAIERTVREWMDLVQRDVSHPSIVTWVPVNESWGVQHVSHDPAQLALVRTLTQLTRALDPSRPVVSNDGWEHAESDLLTIHDYTASGDVLRETYRDDDAVDALVRGMGPAGRRLSATGRRERDDAPVMVTEFGGISFAPGAADDSWGYSVARDAADFEARLRDVIGALHASPVLAGFCYTQLTDTRQETNGLTDERRQPKLPVETIRAIVIGETPR